MRMGGCPPQRGSLEYIANGIRTLKEKEKKENRHLETIVLTFPEVITDSHNENSAQRTSFSGTVDDIGDHLLKIKEMGVNHAIFGLTESDPDRAIDTAKQLSKSIK